MGHPSPSPPKLQALPRAGPPSACRAGKVFTKATSDRRACCRSAGSGRHGIHDGAGEKNRAAPPAPGTLRQGSRRVRGGWSGGAQRRPRDLAEVGRTAHVFGGAPPAGYGPRAPNLRTCREYSGAHARARDEPSWRHGGDAVNGRCPGGLAAARPRRGHLHGRSPVRHG